MAWKYVTAAAVLALFGFAGTAAQGDSGRYRDDRGGSSYRSDSRGWHDWAHQRWGGRRDGGRYGRGGWDWRDRYAPRGRSDYRDGRGGPPGGRDSRGMDRREIGRASDLERRLDRLQRELDELRRDLRRR